MVQFDFDSVLTQVGDFGPYQWYMYVLLCLPASLPSAFTAFNQVFVAAVPDHWCKSENGIGEQPHYIMETDSDGKSRRSQCLQYNSSFAVLNNDSIVTCTNGWEYDQSTYKSSIVTQFDLVCDKENWISMSTTGFYMGSFIGNILFGYIADRWGRRSSFFLILLVQVIFGTLCAFSPNVYAFVVLRFLVGLSFPALYQIPFIVGVEMMGPRARIFAGMVVCIFFGSAMCVLGVVCWALKDWFWITLVSNTPFVLLFSYYFFLPESPRWLASVGRVEEAAKILTKIGRTNGQPVDEQVLLSECRRLHEISLQESTKQTRRPNLIDLFRTPNLRKKTLIITWTWLVNALVYNGLTLNVSNLPVNDYLSFVINGLVELPAYLIVWPLLDRVGRRWPLVALMVFGGLSCIFSLIVPFTEVWVISGLAFAGKFGIAGSFSVIYIFASEQYPTVIRAFGMGMSSMVAGFGLLLAPHLVALKSVSPHLPLLIMGLLMISAAMASMFLPETLGAHLPQTLADAEHFGIGVPFCFCPIGLDGQKTNEHMQVATDDHEDDGHQETLELMDMKHNNHLHA